MILKRIIRVYLILGQVFGSWFSPIISGCLILILRTSSLPKVSVPGAVEAWCALHEQYGRLELRELLAPSSVRLMVERSISASRRPQAAEHSVRLAHPANHQRLRALIISRFNIALSEWRLCTCHMRTYASCSFAPKQYRRTSAPLQP